MSRFVLIALLCLPPSTGATCPGLDGISSFVDVRSIPKSLRDRFGRATTAVAVLSTSPVRMDRDHLRYLPLMTSVHAGYQLGRFTADDIRDLDLKSAALEKLMRPRRLLGRALLRLRTATVTARTAPNLEPGEIFRSAGHFYQLLLGDRLAKFSGPPRAGVLAEFPVELDLSRAALAADFAILGRAASNPIAGTSSVSFEKWTAHYVPRVSVLELGALEPKDGF